MNADDRISPPGLTSHHVERDTVHLSLREALTETLGTCPGLSRQHGEKCASRVLQVLAERSGVKHLRERVFTSVSDAIREHLGHPDDLLAMVIHGAVLVELTPLVAVRNTDLEELRGQIAESTDFDTDDIEIIMAQVAAPLIAARDVAVEQNGVLAAELESVVKQENEEHIALVNAQRQLEQATPLRKWLPYAVAALVLFAVLAWAVT